MLGTICFLIRIVRNDLRALKKNPYLGLNESFGPRGRCDYATRRAGRWLLQLVVYLRRSIGMESHSMRVRCLVIAS